jgi:hypothetical protein
MMPLNRNGPDPSERASLPVQILIWGIITLGLAGSVYLNLTVDLDTPSSSQMPPANLRP